MDILKIMIVDDEAGMRTGAVRALADSRINIPEAEAEVSFELEQAETGEEALEKIKSNPPNILLLDHKLPGISGMDVLEQVPKKEPPILSIMITAYASIETAVKATKVGAFDFLPKPFTPAELRYSVQKAASHIMLARRAIKLAEEKKQVRLQFIRVLGHELKAPIGAVENYMALLKNRTLGGELSAYETAIERSALRLEQMRKLINDLLDVTKIESGTRPRDIVQLDIAEIAKKAIELQELQAAARNISISLESPSPLLFWADRFEIEIILSNLLSNAVKYNKEAGKVLLGLEIAEGALVIKVKDTGIGLCQAEAEKLFNEFVRIKNEKTRNILGSGLGLSIVKRIAQLYKGEVKVESTPDLGSIFIVVLKSAS